VRLNGSGAWRKVPPCARRFESEQLGASGAARGLEVDRSLVGCGGLRAAHQLRVGCVVARRHDSPIEFDAHHGAARGRLVEVGRPGERNRVPETIRGRVRSRIGSIVGLDAGDQGDLDIGLVRDDRGGGRGPRHLGTLCLHSIRDSTHRSALRGLAGLVGPTHRTARRDHEQQDECTGDGRRPNRTDARNGETADRRGQCEKHQQNPTTTLRGLLGGSTRRQLGRRDALRRGQRLLDLLHGDLDGRFVGVEKVLVSGCPSGCENPQSRGEVLERARCRQFLVVAHELGDQVNSPPHKERDEDQPRQVHGLSVKAERVTETQIARCVARSLL